MTPSSGNTMRTDRPTCHRTAYRVGVLFAVSCANDGTESTTVLALPNAPPPPPPRAAFPAANSDARVRLPEGSFRSGTEPGRFERRHELEPRITRTALGPFEIDPDPYPSSTGAPLRGLDRAQAAERCSVRGGRLCTELEWERACKGPGSQPFPSGMDLDAGCTTAPGCASGFGVRGMVSSREWTASDFAQRGERHAILRGALPAAAVADHRCAHREAVALEAIPADVGFRCCYGAPNAARVVIPRLGPAFGKRELPLGELSGLLAADPATRTIAGDLSYFDEPTAIERVLARARRGRGGQQLTTAPLAWNPAPGVELLVVTARSGPSTSFVVVIDELGDGSRQLSSSFVMQGEPGPVVLAYGAVRAEIPFGTCWGCPGETGRVLYHDPDRPSIVQP